MTHPAQTGERAMTVRKTRKGLSLGDRLKLGVCWVALCLISPRAAYAQAKQHRETHRR